MILINCVCGGGGMKNWTTTLFLWIWTRIWGFKGLVRTGAGQCTLLPGRSGGPTMGSLADFTSL